MSYILNVIYVLLLIAYSPWIAYAAIRHGKYRQGWAAKLLGLVPRRRGLRPCVWLHGVSVGEINLLVPLVKELQLQLPQHDCVISTTTRTGHALACSRFAGHTVFYCPLDFSWAVAAAMRRIRPQLLILAELELWPNLIAAARRSGARVAVVNGRLSPSSWRGYRRVRGLMRRLLRRVDLIAVQNDEFAQRFLDLGAPAPVVRVTGSVKFDGAETDRDNPRTRQLVCRAHIATDDVVFLAGSTQAPEESLALDVFQRLSACHPRLRLILVPRHPERFDEVASLLDHSGIAWQRRSQLHGDTDQPTARVLLVDTIGELGAWWRCPHRLCRREPWPPRRPEHDRAGGLRGSRCLWPAHAQLSRCGRRDARSRCGDCRFRSCRALRICRPLPDRSAILSRPGTPGPTAGGPSSGCHAQNRCDAAGIGPGRRPAARQSAPPQVRLLAVGGEPYYISSGRK